MKKTDSKPNSALSFVLAGFIDSVDYAYFFQGNEFSVNLATARRWKTMGGIRRFIAKEKASGSKWDLRILILPQSDLEAAR